MHIGVPGETRALEPRRLITAVHVKVQSFVALRQSVKALQTSQPSTLSSNYITVRHSLLCFGPKRVSFVLVRKLFASFAYRTEILSNLAGFLAERVLTSELTI